jgi:DNA-binding GntR family transcriptional regulator
MTEPTRPQQIADRIVDAILARKLAPGARLGEQPLADLFGVSRTIVREALTRLAARGMVEVNSRRGWFVVQPSREDARAAFTARQVIETGLLQSLEGSPARTAVKRLRQHVAEERAAIAAGDAGERSYLLGDFHVCLAECAGNGLLADILRDLTARTTLISSLYQSSEEATRSCAEHADIVAALERGDLPQAVELMRQHIGSVASGLSPEDTDPLDALRTALAPLGKGQSGAAEAHQAQALHTSVDTKPRAPAKRAAPRKLFTPLLDKAARKEPSA